MIDIKIKDYKASINIKGSVQEMLAEIFLINSNFYEALKEKDPAGALSYEISMMEMIAGSRFSKERITEWLQIQKIITPEEAKDIIKDLIGGKE